MQRDQMRRLFTCRACGFLSTFGEAFTRVRADNGRKVRVCEDCAEQFDKDATVTAWINQAANNDQAYAQAMDVLQNCRAKATVADLYDTDATVAEALKVVIPDFEYPDWSARRISEVVASRWRGSVASL